MRRVMLLRHAKSSWRDRSLDDFDRPLNRRGRDAAPRMGRHMAEQGLRPDLVLCSPARRTRETWDLVSQAASLDVAVRYEERIYSGGAEALGDLARAIPADVHTLMLIGHNPAMEDFALGHAANDGSDRYRDMARKFPTAALAVLDFDIAGWPDLRPGAGRLAAFVKPRDLD